MRTRITQIAIGLALILIAVFGLLVTRLGSQPATTSGTAAKAVQPAAPNAAINVAASQGVAPADEVLPNGVRVIHDTHHDLSPPLRDIPPAPDQPWKEGPENPIPHFISSGPVKDTVVQNFFGPLAMPTPVLTFEGVEQSNRLRWMHTTRYERGRRPEQLRSDGQRQVSGLGQERHFATWPPQR